MSGVFGILSMGKTALLTQQTGINVTGNNISNVNTAGYSRQTLNLVTTDPVSSSPGQLGTGVSADAITRTYDRFLNLQISQENQNLGRWEAQEGALSSVEVVFDESTGYGLNEALSEFWNAWQDLANNPSGSAERIALLGKSETLAGDFQNIYKNLQEIQKDLDASISGSIDEINSYVDQIADLNSKITQTELTGQNANDLRDKRDLLVKDLSNLIDCDYFENSDGMVTVLTAGGKPLVEASSAYHLGTEPSGEVSGLDNVVWIDQEGNSLDITDEISGGKLKGWLEARDVIIPDYMNRLDTLANGIIQSVNDIHSTGYGLDGSTGNDFFTGTSASDIAVNSALSLNLQSIAAAADLSGVPGDNSTAVSIAELQNALTMDGGSSTFDDYYNALVTDAGNAVKTASTNYDHEDLIMTNLETQRESVSGVSIDEETINLMTFQHAYNAAAKLISTVDELLNTIINM